MDTATSMQRLKLHVSDCQQNIVDDTDFMLQRLDQCLDRMAEHCKGGDMAPLAELYRTVLNHATTRAVADVGASTCSGLLAEQIELLAKLVS
jgi:hypothetical protein